ncbi:MAG TPA: RNA polymerase sigma factor [Actinomycetota bacterium]|nr:RNA polymerase sigma factor [Actinomycetota bacterium]
MRPTVGGDDRSRGGRPLNEAEIRGFLSHDYARVVNAVALASGSDPGAEDAVQEALVRAWIRSERGEHIESLPAWVTSVALNLSRSGWRRAVAERRASRRVRAPGEAAAASASTEDQVEVARAIVALPRREREVAVLRYLLGFDTKETAGVLRIGEGTVKSSLARARAHLAERLRVQDLEANDVEGR